MLRTILKLMHKMRIDFMEKSDIYRIFAIGLAVIFVIEMVAIGVFNTRGSTSSKQPGSGGQGSSLNVTGNVASNLTIESYEPYLIVSGNGSAVREALQRMTESGEATYSLQSGSVLIVNLKDASSVLMATAELEGANATVLANAVLSMPGTIRVVGNGVEVDAQGTTFNWQIRPIYPVGSVVPATFVVRAINGQVDGIGSVALLPQFVGNATAEAAVESVQPDYSIIRVEWAGRAAALRLASESGAIYREKSYIGISQDASPQQAYAAGNYSYVTGVQKGIVSVNNDFTDEPRAASDLAALQPVFPPSLAYFANDSGNQTAALFQKMLSDGINATMVRQTRLLLKLPENVEQGGTEYETGGSTLVIEVQGGAQNLTALNVSLDFTANGKSITSITAVRSALDGTQLVQTISGKDAAAQAADGENASPGNYSAPSAMPSRNGTSGPAGANANQSNGPQP